MGKTQAGKKTLSVLLTLCMVLSLLPAMGIAAGASGLDGTVLTINSTDPASGSGWVWDGTKLTLSGVALTQIVLEVDATIVLEGSNKVETSDGTAILCREGDNNSKSLTIEGSGTLAVKTTEAGNPPAIDAGAFTLKSGYVTVCAVGGCGIVADGNVLISGGYLDASSTSNHGILALAGYNQTGGYVKATGGATSDCAGLWASHAFEISGGYLESSGGKGIAGSTTFTNSGGVVKATAPGSTGSVAVQASELHFNGGVTIASVGGSTGDPTSDALGGSCYGSNDEKYYDATDLTSTGNLSTEGTSLTLNSLVIAKAAQDTQYTGTTADSVYVRLTDGVAWQPSANATVTGGSYFEGSQNGLLSDGGHNYNVDINGTLVCISTGTGEGFNIFGGKATMGANATLYGEYTGTAEKAGITAGGGIVGAESAVGYDIIGVTSGTGHAIWAPLGTSAAPITGSVVAVNKNVASGAALGKNIYIGNNGFVTGIAKGASAKAIDVLANNVVSVTGTGALTAIGDTAYYGPEIIGAIITGATSSTSTLTAAGYDNGASGYRCSGSAAPVLLVKADPPIFNDCFGGTSLTADSYSVGDTHPTKGYAFAGWYKMNEYGSYTNALEGAGAAGTTYYAKWTNGAGGKTVRTTPLNLSAAAGIMGSDPMGYRFYPNASDSYNSGDPISASNHPAKTLILDGAIIDTTGGNGASAAALILPAGAKMVVSGDSTVISGLNSGNESHGIDCLGALDISGDGSLTVTAADSAPAHSMGIHTTGDITVSGVTLDVSGGTATGFSFGIYAWQTAGCNVTVTSGSVIARGHDKAFYSNDPTTGTATVVKKTAYDGTGDAAGSYDGAKYVSISYGPGIALAKTADADLTSVYGVTATKSFTITDSRCGSDLCLRRDGYKELHDHRQQLRHRAHRLHTRLVLSRRQHR